MPLFTTTTSSHHHKSSNLYLKSNRAVIKIVQIIIGTIICGLMCGPWHGRPFYDHGCFYYDGRLGYCSGLNFIILLVNIVFFVLNVINVSGNNQPERIFNFIGAALFLIASILILYHIVYHYDHNYSMLQGWLMVSALLIVTMFVLFLVDIKIQQGTASAYHQPRSRTFL